MSEKHEHGYGGPEHGNIEKRRTIAEAIQKKTNGEIRENKDARSGDLDIWVVGKTIHGSENSREEFHIYSLEGQPEKVAVQYIFFKSNGGVEMTPPKIFAIDSPDSIANEMYEGRWH